MTPPPSSFHCTPPSLVAGDCSKNWFRHPSSDATAAEPGGNPTVVQQKVETIVDRFKQLQAKPTDGKSGSSSSGRPKPTARDAGRQTKRTQSTSAVSCNEWLQRHSGDDFVPAAGPKHRTRDSKFEGARAGFVFKLGPRGLGYYRDTGKQRVDMCLDMALRPLRSIPAVRLQLDSLVEQGDGGEQPAMRHSSTLGGKLCRVAAPLIAAGLGVFVPGRQHHPVAIRLADVVADPGHPTTPPAGGSELRVDAEVPPSELRVDTEPPPHPAVAAAAAADGSSSSTREQHQQESRALESSESSSSSTSTREEHWRNCTGEAELVSTPVIPPYVLPGIVESTASTDCCSDQCMSSDTFQPGVKYGGQGDSFKHFGLQSMSNTICSNSCDAYGVDQCVCVCDTFFGAWFNPKCISIFFDQK